MFAFPIRRPRKYVVLTRLGARELPVNMHTMLEQMTTSPHPEFHTSGMLIADNFHLSLTHRTAAEVACYVPSTTRNMVLHAFILHNGSYHIQSWHAKHSRFDGLIPPYEPLPASEARQLTAWAIPMQRWPTFARTRQNGQGGRMRRLACSYWPEVVLAFGAMPRIGSSALHLVMQPRNLLLLLNPQSYMAQPMPCIDQLLMRLTISPHPLCDDYVTTIIYMVHTGDGYEL